MLQLCPQKTKEFCHLVDLMNSDSCCLIGSDKHMNFFFAQNKHRGFWPAFTSLKNEQEE